MKNKPALAIIFLTIFIDLLGFGIIMPLLPSFSVNVLHINEFTIGLMVGIYSLMQFFFNPVWGSLSDRYGRKPVLVMSLIGGVISNLLLAFVFSGIILSAFLFITARAFAGIFAANISAAQAVISDITSPEDRTKGISLISTAFAMGFVFGPAIGGILSENFGYAFPVYVSSSMSLIASLLCIFVFKESLPHEVQLRNRLNKKIINPFNFGNFYKALKNKSYGVFMIIFFVLVFSFSNIFGTIQLFAGRPEGLNFNQAEIGYLFSYMGITGGLVQVFFVNFFKKMIGEENTLVLGCFITIFGLGLIGFSVTVPFLLLVIATLSLGNGISSTVSISLLSQNSGREEQGSVLGLNQSLGSFARFLGPVWGGFVYQFFGYKFPFLTGSLFMLVITVFSYFFFKKRKMSH